MEASGEGSAKLAIIAAAFAQGRAAGLCDGALLDFCCGEAAQRYPADQPIILRRQVRAAVGRLERA
ncbi:MAG TPA: hypothetical protein VEH84_01720 [Alphaproteobacteria bacterium]|nr:hypothetical protein [Alphaproteobacteria bacterium]